MLLLASGSPRRRRLLARLSVPFEVVPSRITERARAKGEAPRDYALALARAKSVDVAGRHPGQEVLAADTVVVLDDIVLGKPVDGEDALRMLRLLRGRWHTVITAVAASCDGETFSDAEATAVHMRDASDEELRSYVATGEPMDKAGAYAVQGLGGKLVDRVQGCYNAVVGLPLCLAGELLARCGVPVDIPPCDHRSVADAAR